jgi:hypothetical protein
MSASTYVGRIGALAAAFGIGAAILTGPAIAWADPASSDTSDTSAPDSPTGSQAAAETGSSAPSRGHAARAAHGARTPVSPTPQSPKASPSSDAQSSDARASDLVDAVQRDLTPRRAGDSAEAAPQQSAEVSPSPAAATTAAKANNDAPAVATVAADPAANTAVPAPSPAAALAAPAPAATQTVTALIETVNSAAAPANSAVAPANSAAAPANSAVAPTPSVTAKSVAPTLVFPTAFASVANKISTAINSVAIQLVNTFSGTSPFAPQVDSPAGWLLFAAARRQPLAAATSAAQAATPASPTLLVLNGYKVVAASKELVTSFYGPFTNFPGSPGIQGQQEYNLVDPATSKTVGSFKALTITFNAVGVARQLVVTEVLSGTAGTAPGNTPPVGSVIASNGYPILGNTVYSAMPSGSGYAVKYDVVTPFVTIPQLTFYNAAEGLTDYGVVNKPLNLADGFYIAPETPSTEKFIATTGLAPLFGSLQGSQTYGLFDKTGAAVGNFEGLVTTTSDALGLFTKEILVTSTGDSTNVGTGIGQVPPVGTVYNIINFTDTFYLLYSAMPSPSGTVISNKLVTPFGSTEIPFPFDATKAPANPFKSLQVPGSYKFVPTSEYIPAGVNGLPPREMIEQGYQQFDVIDAFGRKIGSVDADVARQWDWFGGASNSILVTKVTSGTPGVLGWNVPPAGSVFSTRVLNGLPLGLSDFYSSMPTPLGDLVVYEGVTPFGVIPNILPNDLSKGLTNVIFANPFA